jgi:arylsulfatase A-like enzyme
VKGLDYPPATMAPNVLLIVLDTARRDLVEPYGPGGSTPAIAALARSGVALDKAYATASWTLPSHASMFTGLLPRQIGVAQAPSGTPQSARAAIERVSARALPTVLSQAGYATLGWSTNLWVSPHSGFDVGFDRLEYVTSGRHERMQDAIGGGLRPKLIWAGVGLRSRSDDGATAVGSALRNSIADWSGTPTFWFVNLSECHSPYLPPRPWNDLDPWDRIRAALEAKRHLNFEAICLYAAGRRHISASALQRMRHLYGRAGAFLDDWVASILEALDGRGILDETLVIVTSDHGENFGEGGLLAHGFSLDERLIHVPLIMAGPGARADDEVFSLARLPALVADAAGITAHPWSPQEIPERVAIAQYDPIAPSEDPRIQAFGQKWGLDEPAIDRLCSRFTCAVDGAMKVVMRDEDELVYDLAADPAEAHPLDAAELDGGAEALRAALEHPAVKGMADTPASAVPTAGGSDEELAALERQMKLLGYM